MNRYCSLILAILLAVAAAGGLFWEGLYRDNEFVVPQAKGQDLVTLVVAVPLLAAAIWFARRGSLRARLAALGISGYAAYSYVIYACGSRFNELFLVYVAILGLSVFGLVVGISKTDPEAVKSACGGKAPAKSTAVFFIVTSLLFAFIWLSDIFFSYIAGNVPKSIEQFGTPTNLVYVLDLGFTLPALIITGVLLWRGRNWGFVFAPILLVKVATLGPAILSMALFMWLAGQPVELPMVVIFILITILSLLFTGLFFARIGTGKAKQA
jgi:hypothetical protein